MVTGNRLNPVYRKIGNLVHKARTKARYTQERLAEATGLSRTSIVLIEKGDQRPPIDRLYRIAHALHCEISDLLPRVEDFFKTNEQQILFDDFVKEISSKDRKTLETLLRKNQQKERRI